MLWKCNKNLASLYFNKLRWAFIKYFINFSLKNLFSYILSKILNGKMAVFRSGDLSCVQLWPRYDSFVTCVHLQWYIQVSLLGRMVKVLETNTEPRNWVRREVDGKRQSGNVVATLNIWMRIELKVGRGIMAARICSIIHCRMIVFRFCSAQNFTYTYDVCASG